MTDYKPRWTPHYGDHRERMIGPYTLPTRVELEAEGQRGAPDVIARFEMRAGVPEVVEFSLKAKPNGRAVRTADLNAWQPLEGLAVNAFRLHAWPRDQEVGKTGVTLGPTNERDFWSLGGNMQHSQAARSGPTEAELLEVAQIYRAAVGGRPTEAVQVQMGYASRRTAARRVQQARAAGTLPPTSPGKKKA